MSLSMRRGALALVMALVGCGDGGDPNPMGPAATPTPSTPGGVVQGRYVFRLEPAADCPTPRTDSRAVSFRVDAVPQNGVRPGIRIVQQDAPLVNSEEPILEIELLYTTPTVQGSVATMPWIGSGVRSVEGTYVWIQGIATGSVATGTAGVGEVTEGTIMADLSFGRDIADRDSFSCVGKTHRWSLRVQ